VSDDSRDGLGIGLPTLLPGAKATSQKTSDRLAADLGYSEPTIASLIGHKKHSITSRYVHSADAVLLAAADAVADATIKLMTRRSIVEMWQSRCSSVLRLFRGRSGTTGND
jgi:hypothetical protein